jgi:hypothetical protein
MLWKQQRILAFTFEARKKGKSPECFVVLRPARLRKKVELSGFGKLRRQGEWAFEFESARDSAKKIGAGVAAHFTRRRFTLFDRIRNVTRSLLFL